MKIFTMHYASYVLSAYVLVLSYLFFQWRYLRRTWREYLAKHRECHEE